MTAPFHYPAVPSVRRHGPHGYADYESYRPWLRDEFAFRCVYCLLREVWGPFKGVYALDHFLPIAFRPELALNRSVKYDYPIVYVRVPRPYPKTYYENSDIWGIRILILEPVSDVVHQKHHHFALGSNAEERIRILGEFPVRKFSNDGKQPLDPDGNPDTSFLAKIPADVAWTFQTLDIHGMVLNMAQTWHQVRPGEIRNNCGGCHAHSQQPTLFEKTAAANPDYKVWDLTSNPPLFTMKAADRSGQKWDKNDRTGIRFSQGIKDVEFHRDIKPILQRSPARARSPCRAS